MLLNTLPVTPSVMMFSTLAGGNRNYSWPCVSADCCFLISLSSGSSLVWVLGSCPTCMYWLALTSRLNLGLCEDLWSSLLSSLLSGPLPCELELPWLSWSLVLSPELRLQSLPVFLFPVPWLRIPFSKLKIPFRACVVFLQGHSLLLPDSHSMSCKPLFHIFCPCLFVLGKSVNPNPC